MTNNNGKENEFDDYLKAIKPSFKVEPPNDLKLKIQEKVLQEGKMNSGPSLFMQCAAIGLILILNAMAFYTVLPEQSPLKNDGVAETDLDLLIEDYGFDEYAFSEYLNNE